MKTAKDELAAPCGLYCGACIDYLNYQHCHGCGCKLDGCAASSHHKQCDIYKCCVEQKRLNTCSDCKEMPCAKLIQFCYNPVWMHHLPVIENLRRRKIIRTEKWLKEQQKIWSSEWYLKRWLWFQKECESRLDATLKEEDNLSKQK